MTPPEGVLAMTTTERVLSWLMRIVGAVLMLGGVIYGLLAPADWITVCLLVAYLGVAVLILDVHLVTPPEPDPTPKEHHD